MTFNTVKFYKSYSMYEYSWTNLLWFVYICTFCRSCIVNCWFSISTNSHKVVYFHLLEDKVDILYTGTSEDITVLIRSHKSKKGNQYNGQRVRVMVFNATLNNISVISWPSVLLVEETGVPREKHWPAAGHWQTLSHNVVSSTPACVGFELTTLVVICTDYIAGADPGGAPGAPPPPNGKNMIFWRKIVIFHTKYPKNFRASLRSAQILDPPLHR
jgi:hypothetical protein